MAAREPGAGARDGDRRLQTVSGDRGVGGLKRAVCGEQTHPRVFRGERPSRAKSVFGNRRSVQLSTALGGDGAAAVPPGRRPVRKAGLALGKDVRSLVDELPPSWWFPVCVS